MPSIIVSFFQSVEFDSTTEINIYSLCIDFKLVLYKFSSKISSLGATTAEKTSLLKTYTVSVVLHLILEGMKGKIMC